MRGVTKSIWILLSTALALGCASAPVGSPTAAALEVQLPVLPCSSDDFVADWAPPLPRTLRLQSARTGEVVVAGNWTVHFELLPADAAWLAELRRRHHQVRVSWRGHQVLCDDDSGYVAGLASKQHAEQALAELWPVGSGGTVSSTR
jgi:hypothetical protein